VADQEEAVFRLMSILAGSTVKNMQELEEKHRARSVMTAREVLSLFMASLTCQGSWACALSPGQLFRPEPSGGAPAFFLKLARMNRGVNQDPTTHSTQNS
jgi:hypothetical protein